MQHDFLPLSHTVRLNNVRYFSQTSTLYTDRYVLTLQAPLLRSPVRPCLKIVDQGTLEQKSRVVGLLQIQSLKTLTDLFGKPRRITFRLDL